jgi:hypothetical protein
VLSPPPIDAAATSHKSPSSLSLQRLEPPLLVLNLASTLFSASDFTMDHKRRVHDGNRQQSFATPCLKPNNAPSETKRSETTWVRTTKAHPAICRHKASSGVCRQSLLKLDTRYSDQINENRHQSDLRLGGRGTI